MSTKDKSALVEEPLIEETKLGKALTRKGLHDPSTSSTQSTACSSSGQLTGQSLGSEQSPKAAAKGKAIVPGDLDDCFAVRYVGSGEKPEKKKKARHLNAVLRGISSQLSGPPTTLKSPRRSLGNASMLKSFSHQSSSGSDDEPALMVQVNIEEEALLGYRAVLESEDGQVEIALRVPLLLASASQLPDDNRTVFVTLPTAEDLHAVKGMQIAPCEAHSLFQEPLLLPEGERTFRFACASKRAAEKLLHRLSLAGCTMKGLLDRYRLRKEVGSGGFGRVYLAHDTWNGEEVAVKVFLNHEPREFFHPLREATLLRWAKNPLFPEFKAVYTVLDDEFNDLGLSDQQGVRAWALVTEYLPGGELFTFMGKHGPLPEECAQAVMRQVFGGLAALHERGILHRDIKPENVLLAGSGNQVKLVDFGLACPRWDKKAASARVGSVGYLAPEVLASPSPPQSTKVDCFSAGVLLFTCLAGHGPFQGRSVKEILVKNLHNRIDVQSVAAMPKGARELVMKLMDNRPDKRPSAAECLKHPWLQPPRDETPEPVTVSSSESVLGILGKIDSKTASTTAMGSAGPTCSRSSFDSSDGDDTGQRRPNDVHLHLPVHSVESLTALAAVKQGSKKGVAMSDATQTTAAPGEEQRLTDMSSMTPTNADASSSTAPASSSGARVERSADRRPSLKKKDAPHARGSGVLAARVLRVRFRAEGEEEEDQEEGKERQSESSVEELPTRRFVPDTCKAEPPPAPNTCLQEFNPAEVARPALPPPPTTSPLTRRRQFTVNQAGGASSSSQDPRPQAVPAAQNLSVPPPTGGRHVRNAGRAASVASSSRQVAKYASADEENGDTGDGAQDPDRDPTAASSTDLAREPDNGRLSDNGHLSEGRLSEGRLSERMSERLSFKRLRQAVAESTVHLPRFMRGAGATAGKGKSAPRQMEKADFDFLPLVPGS